ncbi:MAG: hypothetical protein B7X52_08040 [Thiotrichales bacterium 34-46-19]|nr:MAG: hypothetical protein B7X52_08040 [Thiotrichales bacterium 34-46-19]
MLLSLHIRNFVLVDEAQLNVEAGLTVLTGETGAGKSLLLDALGAVLGDKAQPFWVRPGCDKAEVSAEFNVSELPSAQHWLAEQELADDDQCLLRRVINNDGRSKAYINGTSVTLGQLRQLAEMLIELHSQHEHHALLTAQRQLALIDTWSQNHAMRKQVKQAWQAWHELYQQQPSAVNILVLLMLPTLHNTCSKPCHYSSTTAKAFWGNSIKGCAYSKASKRMMPV